MSTYMSPASSSHRVILQQGPARCAAHTDTRLASPLCWRPPPCLMRQQGNMTRQQGNMMRQQDNMEQHSRAASWQGTVGPEWAAPPPQASHTT